MNDNFPLVTIIIPTYNRANTVERTLNSIFNQSYGNLELIIVDDGSTDATQTVLSKYSDPRIRMFRHDVNKGVTAAKNTGLKNIKGEWFTILDSDDEIVPDAIETMLNIPLYFDTSVTAVTCNCLDTSENKFAGLGLTSDQYLNVPTLMTVCKGEFWGLTKTSLLMDEYFNENFSGLESILWYKIDDRAKRYYIHKPLRIYHTEGNDRVSNFKYNSEREIRLYSKLIEEVHYLNKIEKYNLKDFINLCRNGLVVTRADHNKKIALAYYNHLNKSNKTLINKLILNFWIVAVIMKEYTIIKFLIKPYLKSL